MKDSNVLKEKSLDFVLEYQSWPIIIYRVCPLPIILYSRKYLNPEQASVPT